MVEPGLDALRPLHGGLAHDQGLEARVDVALQDREFVVAVAGEAFNFLTLDLQGAFVLVHAMTVEDPHFDDGAESARAAAAARCRGRPRPFHRRWRGGVFLPASSGFRPSG